MYWTVMSMKTSWETLQCVSNTSTLDTYNGKVKNNYTGKTCPTCADIVDVIWSVVVGIQRGRARVHRHPGPSVQHHW